MQVKHPWHVLLTVVVISNPCLLLYCTVIASFGGARLAGYILSHEGAERHNSRGFQANIIPGC